MSSGVAVHKDCLSAYQDLKLGHKHTYIIYTLNQNNTEIVVEKTGTVADYDEFLGGLPELECRWAVYDFNFMVEGGKRNKIVFFSWSPDDAKIKNKMLFASSKDALRRSLEGVGAEIQGTDFSEVSHDAVLEKVKR